MWLVVANGALVGLSHAFEYAIIKYETAVLQTTIALTIIFTTWLFFLIWPYKGHSDFNALTLVGMVILAVGSLWYIHADHKQNGHLTVSNIKTDADVSTMEDEQIIHGKMSFAYSEVEVEAEEIEERNAYQDVI